MSGGTFVAEKATIASLTVTSLTSSIVTSSILLTEGSNIFGDAASDSHRFTGSIFVSSSGTIGPNSAAGIEFGDGTHGNESADITIFTDTNGEIHLKRGGSNKISVQDNGIDIDEEIHVRDGSFNNAIVLSQNGHITASGNISASGTGTHTFGGNVKIDNPSTVGQLFIDSAASSDVVINLSNTDTQKAKIGWDHSESALAFVVGTGAFSSAGMVLDSTGVGIGTAAPGARRRVDSATAFSLTAGSGDTLLLTNDSTTSAVGAIGPTIGFGNMNSNRRTSAIGTIRTGADHDNMGLAFFTHAGDGNDETIVQQMTIAHDGNVGIGTTTPGSELHVVGDISASGDMFLQNNKFIKQRLTNGTVVTVFGYDSSNFTRVGANAEIQLGGEIKFNFPISTHITASGNISASGIYMLKNIIYTVQKRHT